MKLKRMTMRLIKDQDLRCLNQLGNHTTGERWRQSLKNMQNIHPDYTACDMADPPQREVVWNLVQDGGRQVGELPWKRKEINNKRRMKSERILSWMTGELRHKMEGMAGDDSSEHMMQGESPNWNKVVGRKAECQQTNS